MYTQEQLIDFLLRAKRATYAGKGAETPAFRPGAHDLLYREEDLLYYDTYLGGDLFAGEEAVERHAMSKKGPETKKAEKSRENIKKAQFYVGFHAKLGDKLQKGA